MLLLSFERFREKRKAPLASSVENDHSALDQMFIELFKIGILHRPNISPQD